MATKLRTALMPFAPSLYPSPLVRVERRKAHQLFQTETYIFFFLLLLVVRFLFVVLRA